MAQKYAIYCSNFKINWNYDIGAVSIKNFSTRLMSVFIPHNRNPQVTQRLPQLSDTVLPLSIPSVLSSATSSPVDCKSLDIAKGS